LEPPRLLNFDFDADQDPAFDFDVDPDRLQEGYGSCGSGSATIDKCCYLSLQRYTHPLLLRADEEATENNNIRNKTAYCLTSSAIAAANITFLHLTCVKVGSATFIKEIKKTHKKT
jgi:hypothetical protein